MQKIKKLPVLAKLLLVVVVAVIGYAVYSKLNGSSQSKVTYQTAQAEKGTLIVSVSSSGQVAATNSRTVTTTASGVVRKVYVTEGQKVTTGTPIMQIDLDMDGQQQFQQASAQYQQAQNNLASAQSKLYDLQAASVNASNIFNNQFSQLSPDDPSYIQKHDAMLSAQSSYQQQQNVIQQSQISLQSAKLSYLLASPTVYAPISGTVSAISLTPGMILNPTSTAANSTNSSNKIAIVKTNTTPAITVNLTEIDVPKIKVGDQATITLDAFPDKTFTGKVIAIDTAGTVSSNVVNYPTTIQLDSDVAEILSNMSATANIISDVKNDVILVPNAAVQTSNGQSTVRVLKNGQPASVNVEVGESNDSQTEIVSGINEGDTVVTGTSSSSTSRSSSTSGSVFGGGNRGFGGGAGGGAVRVLTR